MRGGLIFVPSPPKITRRYAEFSSAIVSINQTFPNERTNALLGQLQVGGDLGGVFGWGGSWGGNLGGVFWRGGVMEGIWGGEVIGSQIGRAHV